MDLRQLLSDVRPLIPTYAHLLVSAIFPIYAGAHASLSRPSSAKKPERKRPENDNSGNVDEDEGEDEEEDDYQRMEGLSPTDAIMFPVMAGCTLAGLYFLIKWLQDPALLNKILNAYFAIFGALSVAKLLADTLGLVQNIIFPNLWVHNGVVWKVNSKERKAVAVHGGGATKTTRAIPLPGTLSLLPLGRETERMLWLARELPRHKWTLQLYIQHLVSGKVHVGINGFVGVVLAILAAIYYNLVDKPWYLTNLMGFGFSYSALQLLSPTTFSTGALILSALFFYDIYFVFYTPMMVTVAKSLDVPIKLLFPRPAAPGETPEAAARSHAMLGLGDVVLPGIMIGLALRYDLFMYYVRKQRRVEAAPSTTLPKDDKAQDVSPTDAELVKAPFASVSGRFGDSFWTHSWVGRSLLPTPSNDSRISETSFPKPFFKASVAGYLTGLLVTLIVMHIWGHAQPALLYLVPGVLLSLLLTGAVRGELTPMWNYTEEEEVSLVADAKERETDNGVNGNSTNPQGPADVKAGDARAAESLETVRIGLHDEQALIKFSVSKRFSGRNTGRTGAAKEVTVDDGDSVRRSSRLQDQASPRTDDERPSKRSRVL